MLNLVVTPLSLMMQLHDKVTALAEDLSLWKNRAQEAEAELARVRVQLAGIQSGADSSLAEVMAMARDEAERHAQTKAAKAVLERTLAELSDQLQEQAQAADDEKRLLRQVQLLLLRCPKLLLLANQAF